MVLRMLAACLVLTACSSDADDGGTPYSSLPRTYLPQPGAEPNYLEAELTDGAGLHYRATLVQPSAGLDEYYSSSPVRAEVALADLLREHASCEAPSTSLGIELGILAKERLIQAYCESLGGAVCNEHIQEVQLDKLGCE